MDSRTFIKEAGALVKEIKAFSGAYLGEVDEAAQRTGIQRRLNNLYSGLANPTLPTAYKLRDAALAANFVIDAKRLYWLASHEYLS